jgi:transketolase
MHAIARPRVLDPVRFDISSVEHLQKVAGRVRVESMRMVARVEGGHPGGSLSAADLLVALYFHELAIRPDEPDWPRRDRFILSKGHACEAYYATMALRGYFPIEELATFGEIDSRLQGHPDRTKLPGVEMSTGSLGMGLSAGLGMALGARMQAASQRVYVLLGDGECQEGSVFEAMWAAPRLGVDNLTAIVDLNGLQQTPWPPSGDGPREYPWSPGHLARLWDAAGWHVLAIDGHDLHAILRAFDAARQVGDRPSAIIATTIKGRGVSFMEDRAEWHSRVPTDDELAKALEELDAQG